LCASSYQIKSSIAGLAPGRLHIERDQGVLQQPVARLGAKALQVQRGAVRERACGTHGMDARKKAADPFQHLEVVQLGLAPATPWADGELEAAVRVQRAAVHHQRADGGHLGGHEFGGEGMFFEDLRLAPAPWAVELGHHAAAVLQRGLVHAVLVGRQGHEPPIAIQAHAGQRVEHGIGREGGEGVERRGVGARVHPLIFAATPAPKTCHTLLHTEETPRAEL